MSYLGPIDNLRAFPWTYEVDFTAPDAAEQYARAGFRCVRSTPTEYVDSNLVVRKAEAFTPVFEFDKETGRPLGLRCEKAHNNHLQHTENLHLWGNWYGGLPGLTKGAADPAGGNEAWSFRLVDLPQGPGVIGEMMGGIVNSGLTVPVEGVVHTAEVWVRCDAVRPFLFGFSDATRQFIATPEWQRFRFTDPWTVAKDQGRVCEFVFSYLTSEVAASTVNSDMRFYIWHPWMGPGSVGMSYVKADSALATAAVDYHYADLLPMFAGYNAEGALFLEWERKGQTVNGGNTTSSLLQMSMAGAQPTTNSFLADERALTNTVVLAQYWNGQASSVSGPLRNDGSPGGKGIQRMAFGWFKSGSHAPGAAINAQSYRAMSGATAISSGIVPFSRLLLGARLGADPLDGYIRKLRFSASFNPNETKDTLPVTPTAQLMSEMTSERLLSSGDFI